MYIIQEHKNLNVILLLRSSVKIRFNHGYKNLTALNFSKRLDDTQHTARLMTVVKDEVHRVIALFRKNLPHNNLWYFWP